MNDSKYIWTSEEKWVKEVASRLREKLNLSGMSNRELSRKTGIPNSSLSRYINGESTMQGYTFFKIAKVLGCNKREVAYILCLR